MIKGRDFGLQIDPRIRAAKAFIVLRCRLSVVSRWVHEEMDLADELGKGLRDYDNVWRRFGTPTLAQFAPAELERDAVVAGADLNDNYEGAPTAGDAWLHENKGDCSRVLRGGAWVDDPRYLRSAYRIWDSAVGADFPMGFRLARTL